MTWLFANWRLVLGAGVVAGALLASYGKGYLDSNTKWELKYATDMNKMHKAGTDATNRALAGWRSDVEKYRNRKPAPVVRLHCPNLPDPASGAPGAGAEESPGEMGRAVEAGRIVGEITSEILDEADLELARCNRLKEWWLVQARKTFKAQP